MGQNLVVTVFAMMLVDGLGRLLGLLIGAVSRVPMLNNLASYGAWVMVIQGAIFVACVLFFRQGLVGTARQYLPRRRTADRTHNLP